MARRRGKPATAFGAWLEEWLRTHDDVTFEALGERIGVTKSAISLWLAATHQAEIPIPRLRRLADATGTPVGHLEQLVIPGGADEAEGRQRTA